MSVMFTARPASAQRRIRLAVAVVVFFTIWHTVGAMFGASAATSATISGTAFQDLDRNGVQDPGEAPFADHVIYLIDSSGSLLTYRTTDSQGHYAFNGLEPGTYEVQYMRRTWREIWSDWAPTTTESVFPTATVELGGTDVTVDFGWRPITWSTDLNNPISEHVGESGLTVQSYNDVVTARELHDYITDNFLVGDEAPTTRVRFAYKNLDRASTQIQQSNGEVTHVQTTAYASYQRLLSQGSFQTVAHEYGHAWMNYHNYYVLQDVDRKWRTYLEARGIDPDDDRLGSSHAWMPYEIAAEDYRQLFTTAATSADRHMNRDIPDAGDVDGLRELLRDLFVKLEADPQDGEPEPGTGEDESADPAPEPDPGTGEDESTDPEPEPSSAVADPDLELTVTTYKVRGVNHADLAWAGHEGADVIILRNGSHLADSNGSQYTDNTGTRGSVSYTYQVCVSGADTCSAPVEASS